MGSNIVMCPGYLSICTGYRYWYMAWGTFPVVKIIAKTHWHTLKSSCAAHRRPLTNRSLKYCPGFVASGPLQILPWVEGRKGSARPPGNRTGLTWWRLGGLRRNMKRPLLKEAGGSWWLVRARWRGIGSHLAELQLSLQFLHSVTMPNSLS